MRDESIYESFEILTMNLENGEQVDFYEIATLDYNQKSYAILQPVELLEGMDEDSFIVFRVEPIDEETANYFVEENDEIVENVFKEYEKLCEE